MDADERVEAARNDADVGGSERAPSRSFEVVGPARFAQGTRELVPIDATSTLVTRFAATLAALPDPAFAIDHRGTVLDANTQVESIVGRPRRDLIGSAFSTIVQAPPGCCVYANGGEHARFVPAAAGIRLRHVFGSQPVAVLVCPHDARSSIVVLRGPSEGAPRLREDDVAQIAHDFKNPLSLMALEIDVVEHQLEAGVPIDVKPVMTRIQQNVAFLDRMVHELLDLCSLEAGRLELRLAPTELQTLLEGVIERVVRPGERSRVILDAKQRSTILIDDLRIQRVVANLLGNALKYAPAATGIVVRLEVLPHATRVSVSDAGPGLTPVEMAYVFDKYRRGGSQHHVEGTGIGLFVSKQIIEAHRGIIGVDSSRGIGSRFFFELPA